MVESSFPIIEARQELGFTPTTAVRAEGDFSTGEGAVGVAAGEALVAGAKVLQKKSAERLFLETEQIKKLDTNREITANAIISNAETEHEGFKAATADATLWEKDLGERMEKARQQISDLGLLEDTGELVNTKLNARLSVGTKETFKEATLKIIEDTKKAADLNYMEALQSFDKIEEKEAKALWIQAYAGNTTTVDQRILFKELTRKGFEQRNETVKGDAIGNAFDIWQQTITPENLDGDLTAAFASIEADPRVSEADKQEVESELKTRVANRRAETKLALDKSEAESVETINGWINDDDLDNITNRIKELPLTETKKRAEIKRANDYIRTVNGYRKDIVTSDATRIKVLQLTSSIKNRTISLDEGIEAYNRIASGITAEPEELITLEPDDETKFQEEYAKTASELGLSPDPNDPLHFYDYRALFEETGKLPVGPQKHFPSKFKLLGHPRLIIDGKDTRTGKKATPELAKQNKEAREIAEGTFTVKPIINTTDGKSFINGMFAASESAKNVVRQRQASIFDEREKQLRDSIEGQPNIFDPQLATELLKDFANEAIIELNDKFREDEFTKEELDIEVDRLIRKFTLSEVQQNRAVFARELKLAETLETQQESITKTVASLRNEGRTEEAKEIMDEAIRLGIFEFESEGTAIKKTKGKKRELPKKLLDRILRR